MDTDLVKQMIDIGLADLIKYKIADKATREDHKDGVKVYLTLTKYFTNIIRSHFRKGQTLENSIILSIMAYAPEASEQDWSGMYAVIVNCMDLIKDDEITKEEEEQFDKIFKKMIQDRSGV